MNIKNKILIKIRDFLPRIILIIVIAVFLALILNIHTGKASSKTRLRYMVWGDSPQTTNVFKEVVAEFERLNPNMDVELLIVPWGEYHRKIFTMIAAGSKLDVMVISSQYFPQLIERNALYCIDDFIKRDSTEIDLSDYYDKMMEIVNGHYYGMPVQGYAWSFYYNKNLFDEAKIPYPDRTWTWNGKFLETAKSLTKDINGDGIIDQFGCIIPLYYASIMRVVRLNGGEMFNEDNSRCIFNSPQTREAIKFISDLINVYKVAPGPDPVTYNTMFNSGVVAMMPGLRSWVPVFREQLPFEWDVGPTPHWEGKKPVYEVLLGDPYVIYKKTENPEASWKLLKFLTGKKAAKIFAKSGRFGMARKSAAESDEFLKTTPPEHNEYFLDEARTPGNLYHPPFPRSARLEEIFRNNLSIFFQNELSVEKFTEKTEKEVNDLIAEEAKRKKAQGNLK